MYRVCLQGKVGGARAIAIDNPSYMISSKHAAKCGIILVKDVRKKRLRASVPTCAVLDLHRARVADGCATEGVVVDACHVVEVCQVLIVCILL